MTAYEITYLIICLITIIASFIAITISIKAKKQAKESADRANELSKKSLDKADIQNLIALGSIELVINERITQTRQKVSEVTMNMAPLMSKSDRSEDEQKTLDIYIKTLHSEIENNINAYEEACMKYLDGKIDTVRFKKSYFTELRQLVEHEKYKKYFDGVSSRYKAILKVYDEWFNLEK